MIKAAIREERRANRRQSRQSREEAAIFESQKLSADIMGKMSGGDNNNN